MNTHTTHSLTGVLGEVADLLIEEERRWQENGWDNNQPAWYRIERLPGGELGTLKCGLGGMTHPDAQPRDDLYRLARVAEMPHWADSMKLMLPDPPVGHMLLMEAWVNYDELTEEQRGCSLADIPGSLEARNGLALVGKRTLMLHRERGQEPLVFVDGQDGFHLKGDGAGSMFQSIIDLHVANLRMYRG